MFIDSATLDIIARSVAIATFVDTPRGVAAKQPAPRRRPAGETAPEPRERPLQAPAARAPAALKLPARATGWVLRRLGHGLVQAGERLGGFPGSGQAAHGGGGCAA